MIISDLEHLEVVAEANNIVGGSSLEDFKALLLVFTSGLSHPKLPVNEASADADATALGTNTETITNTKASVVQGQGSSSHSDSFAKAY